MTQQQETKTIRNLPLHMHNTIQCLLIVHIDLQKSLLILWNLFNFILQLFLLLVTLPPVPLKYEEENYSQDDDSDTNSENEEQQNTGPTHIPDPIHMPKQENEMPQEDIPQNETQTERPHTPDPDNPIQDNTEYANPNYEMPEEMPHAQPQPTTSNANANTALPNCMESPNCSGNNEKDDTSSR